MAGGRGGRDFLVALNATEIDLDREIDGQSLRDWLAWAERRFDAADPLNHGAESVFEAIAAVTEWTHRA